MADDATAREMGRDAMIELLGDALAMLSRGPGLAAWAPIDIAEGIVAQLPLWILVTRAGLTDAHIAGAAQLLREVAELMEATRASSAVGRSGPMTWRD